MTQRDQTSGEVESNIGHIWMDMRDDTQNRRVIIRWEGTTDSLHHYRAIHMRLEPCEILYEEIFTSAFKTIVRSVCDDYKTWRVTFLDDRKESLIRGSDTKDDEL